MALADGFLSDVGEVEYIPDPVEYLELAKLWEESEEFWHHGDYPSAIEALRKIIDLDPAESEAYANAAWLLDSSDRIFEGFDLLVQNMVANPRNGDAYSEIASKYFYMGGYQEAVKKLETSLIYSPSTITQRMLAHAYERANRREKAIEMFASILGNDPSDGAALSNLLRLLARIPSAFDPTRLWHRPSVKEDGEDAESLAAD